MSKALIDRLRRARQTSVLSLGRTFTVRRPTDLEMQEIHEKIEQRLLLVRFVTGWGSMSEIDLGIPGGGPDPVSFDPALWEEWIADHPEHWPALTSAIFDAYKAHRGAMEEAAKNSAPGSAA
jgi:hypothetical protein